MEWLLAVLTSNCAFQEIFNGSNQAQCSCSGRNVHNLKYLRKMRAVLKDHDS